MCCYLLKLCSVYSRKNTARCDRQDTCTWRNQRVFDTSDRSTGFPCFLESPGIFFLSEFKAMKVLENKAGTSEHLNLML